MGLPNGGRRRTPGLRREEVAMLAGVGTTWYTWLEQGRDVRASVEVLDAIADALHMTTAERSHLLLLGRGEEPPPPSCPESVAKSLRTVIDNLENQPAFILGRRFDYLTWNHAATFLFGDLAQVPTQQRNHIWLTFMDPARRELFTDWEYTSRVAVAKFRVEATKNLGDPSFEALISSLRKASPEFCRAWKLHEVHSGSAGRKVVNHPQAGRLVFEHVVLNPQEQPDQRLALYVPLPEEDSAARFAELIGD
ncbi:MAG: helix-turn-helix domain-containing protein [Solirubrobacterales bacterium]|nr:helix-turn-helix domain-containing protein [Solirubrobacterales bacterium]